MSIRGLWDFRPYGTNAPWQKLRFEKEWRLQGIQNTAVGEYRLTIHIPEHLHEENFALLLPPLSAAVQIYFNGALAYEKGSVSTVNRYPQNSSEAFFWYPIKKELLRAGIPQELRVVITGFQGGGGAFGNSFAYFGGEKEIQEKFNFLLAVTVFLAASIFMIAVFHFALARDKNYRRANLHYVVLSLAMSCHIAGMNGLGYYLFDNFIFNAALIHTLFAVFPFAVVGFTLRYFRLNFPRLRRSVHYFAVLMILFLTMLIAFPSLIPVYMNYVLPVAVVAMALSLLFAVYGVYKGIKKKIEGAALILFGFFVYGVGVLNDVAFYFFYSTPYKLADFGFLVVVVCIAIALANRLQSAAQEKEELRDWKKEITLAAQIQHQALSQRRLATEYLQIETLFKPMKIIGGDFFAFHEISNNCTGIFLADVSGHGIAAALMVNTLQNVFLQQRDCAHDPSLLMHNMNKILYPQLNEQFVTAAYCFIDSGTNQMRFAQAGHPPIYLLQNNSTHLEKVKPKGRFLGFDKQIEYETEVRELKRYSRVFIYSDGIIEAGSQRGTPYTVNRLEKFLQLSTALKGDSLLSALESDVQTVTHTALNTDDDSSCVVVDLKVA
ncbi:MAG TPA: SpoIIE family protein phosphatase [Turneriella sp.]|nr:SpoIIE family protein phosphatase [Turneriella sp.]